MREHAATAAVHAKTAPGVRRCRELILTSPAGPSSASAGGRAGVGSLHRQPERSGSAELERQVTLSIPHIELHAQLVAGRPPVVRPIMDGKDDDRRMRLERANRDLL